jgi:hypothetical protein
VRKFLVLMCGEVLMGGVCVRIKHERNLCSKCLWQSLWTSVQLVVSLKSTVGFVSNLNQF